MTLRQEGSINPSKGRRNSLQSSLNPKRTDHNDQTMRKKEITKLLRALLQDFPDYEVQGDMMYGVPISHVLKGVVLDRSISPSDYYAHVFLQPLYVPSEHVVLSLGWRLGGGVRSWNLDSEQDREEFARLLNVEAIPFLNKIHGPQDII